MESVWVQVIAKVLASAWPLLVLLLLLGVLQGVLRSATFKGWWGERKVRSWLAQGLPADDYLCCHDVLLRLQDGSTTQIDHVVFSPYGVFVLETKHYRGWIFGSARQTTWTQSLYQQRYSFQNPLHQNWRHVQALHQLLQIPLEQLHSGVVFTGECTFKTPMPANVLQGADCVPWIRAHTRLCLDMAQAQVLAQRLMAQALQPGRAARQAHVQHVKERQAQAAARRVVPGRRVEPLVPAATVVKKSPMAVASSLPQPQPQPQPQAFKVVAPTGVGPAVGLPTCPECGAELVARRLEGGSQGARPFWRCSDFPRCRFLWVQPQTHLHAPASKEPVLAVQPSS